MGKKKVVKKTKELSVAIAESSSLDAAEGQQQTLTPRKRGRPRKIIVEKTEAEEQVKEEDIAAQEGHDDDIEGSHQFKNVKISSAEEVEEEEEKGQPSKTKEEATTTTTTTSSSSSKRQLPTRSRARRKSKPRKSS